MSETIEPALTPEEWAKMLRAGGPARYDSVFEFASPEVFHYLAALALHGQSFGFTHADVDLLRRSCADKEVNACAFVMDPEGTDALQELADRIEALLPPREP